MNFIGHLKTVNHHRRLVRKGCFSVGLYWQGLTHDLSKYSFAEFWQGVKYFQGTRSPNAREREEKGYSVAWMHHKGRNKHHYEYWTDYDAVTKNNGPVAMPVRYVTEMFCDRVAACKTYMKDKYTDRSALEYYDRKKGHRSIHPETKELLERLLVMLADKGEDETFAYIRTLKK